jgi:hypothetical protein
MEPLSLRLCLPKRALSPWYRTRVSLVFPPIGIAFGIAIDPESVVPGPGVPRFPLPYPGADGLSGPNFSGGVLTPHPGSSIYCKVMSNKSEFFNIPCIFPYGEGWAGADQAKRVPAFITTIIEKVGAIHENKDRRLVGWRRLPGH